MMASQSEASSAQSQRGLAVEAHAKAGEHFRLPMVGQMAGEAVVEDLGDERGRGGAAVLQAGWQRGDEGLG